MQNLDEKALLICQICSGEAATESDVESDDESESDE